MNDIRNQHRTQLSLRVMQVLFATLCLVVLGRVFYLQVIEYEKYSMQGERNSIRQEIIPSARGLVYDRKGELLVSNEPIFTLTVNPATYDTSNNKLLAKLLDVEVSQIREQVKTARRYSWYRSSPLLSDIDFTQFAVIQQNLWQLPGIGHQLESKRTYTDKINASHIFGYLREADTKDFENNTSLFLGDKIGKSGLELVYEERLRGESGLEFKRVNAYGQALGSFVVENEGTNPIAGANIITTIDADLQAFAEDLMIDKTGAIIVMNPNNGAILTMVSSPNYQVDRLAGRLDRTYWAHINSDSTRPLFNRAVSSRQPPGSTFKPLMGLIGLEEGLITPTTNIPNTGGYQRGRLYRDIAPKGDYNLEKAITFSSNTYFYRLMDDIASSGRLNIWSERVKDFGLGIDLEIDLPSATTGIVPDSAFLDRWFGVRKWGLGDLINLGIGQGVMSVSPLQIATMTSAIANGGYRITPYLVEQLETPYSTNFPNKRNPSKIDWVQKKHLDLVKKGMRGVVQEGSGRFYVKNDSIAIAGKTGTAQNPHGYSHGWFTSFAPFENPEIVVTVFLENAGFASISAAPIARLLHEYYLRGTYNSYVYNYVKNWEPREDNSNQTAE